MPRAEKFIHLHNHTEYSLLDGASRISDLLKRTKEFGMSSLAITDHGNMYGVVDFYVQAKEVGIKPILGCEVYVAPRSRFQRDSNFDRSSYHLTLLAKDQRGYKNLMQLVTLASLEGFYGKPRIDKEILEKFSAGLVVLSGCTKGEIPRLLVEGRKEEAEKLAIFFRELFGQDFYLEIMETELAELKTINPGLLELAKKLELKLVATNDSHYIYKKDAFSQDVLLCIQTNAYLDEGKRLKFGSQEFYLKSGEEMEKLFSYCPEALLCTQEIAEKCNLELEIGKLHLPDFPVPEEETPETYLEKLVWEGVKKRISEYQSISESGKVLLPPEIIDRVKSELYTIEKMGYASYFLIIQDLISWAKSNGIQVGPGRGSAAGSIVSYALGITNVDPLKYGLIFERFLNPERITMPDIDMDFCFERRGEVIDYVSKKYGKDHVAQIVTFGTMMARGAIRDVGRVQRIPLAEVDRIAKMAPFGPDVTIQRALDAVKELRELYERDEKVKNLLEVARKLEGMPRHASVHAAGVVVSKRPLTEYVPLQKVDENVVVTQYPMEDLEKIGLLKMDFLGLRNLTMIAHALKIIKDTPGIEIDINQVPLDDAKTYQLLSAGETLGVFQLESRGMRALVKELKPSAFEDVIALLALYRPGPLESGMVSDFIKRKNRQVEVRYELAELAPILKETHGVILYQEQVMEIASKIAGFEMSQADILRQAMGKKKVKEMQEQKERFIEGAIRRRISRHKAAELFNLCAKFAGYGFNKSHSTAYGLVSYQTAYLKAHFPVEFMAALLTSVMGNTDKVTAYITECRRLGINIFPPDINESQKHFTVLPQGIRFGLSAIKNVGEAAIESIFQAREKGGSFTSLIDFVRRVDSRAVNKKVIESLIKAGAFDSLKAGRAYLLRILQETLDRVNREEKERANGQGMLFDFQSTEHRTPSTEPRAEEIEEFPPEQLLRLEKEMLGLYISSHPLEHIRDSLEVQTNVRIAEIQEMEEGKYVKTGGILSEGKKLVTRRGDTMLAAKLEDLTASISLVVFPKTYEKHAHLLTNDLVVLVSGRINRDPRTDELNLVVEIVEPLEEREKVRTLQVELLEGANPQIISHLKEILSVNKGGETVYLRLDGKSIALGKDYQVEISPGLVTQLEELLGRGAVKVEFRAPKKELMHEYGKIKI